MKTILLSALSLLACLHAFCQPSIAEADRVVHRYSGDVPELLLQQGGRRQFADYFMKDATLMNAAGEILVGRKKIADWYGERPDSRVFKAGESTSRIQQNIHPDLAVVLAKTSMSGSGRRPRAEYSYNILWRKIDGKWYIESCTIVVSERGDPKA